MTHDAKCFSVDSHLGPLDTLFRGVTFIALGAIDERISSAWIKVRRIKNNIK